MLVHIENSIPGGSLFAFVGIVLFCTNTRDCTVLIALFDIPWEGRSLTHNFPCKLNGVKL